MADQESANLRQFSRLVLADPCLHTQLRAAASENDFVALAVRLGAAHDCHFKAATRQMFAAAQLNAKNPVLPFAADRAAKRQAASAELQALAQGRLGEIYQQLETQQAAAGFA